GKEVLYDVQSHVGQLLLDVGGDGLVRIVGREVGAFDVDRQACNLRADLCEIVERYRYTVVNAASPSVRGAKVVSNVFERVLHRPGDAHGQARNAGQEGDAVADHAGRPSLADHVVEQTDTLLAKHRFISSEVRAHKRRLIGAARCFNECVTGGGNK